MPHTRPLECFDLCEKGRSRWNPTRSTRRPRRNLRSLRIRSLPLENWIWPSWSCCVWDLSESHSLICQLEWTSISQSTRQINSYHMACSLTIGNHCWWLLPVSQRYHGILDEFLDAVRHLQWLTCCFKILFYPVEFRYLPILPSYEQMVFGWCFWLLHRKISHHSWLIELRRWHHSLWNEHRAWRSFSSWNFSSYIHSLPCCPPKSLRFLAPLTQIILKSSCSIFKSARRLSWVCCQSILTTSKHQWLAARSGSIHGPALTSCPSQFSGAAPPPSLSSEVYSRWASHTGCSCLIC